VPQPEHGVSDRDRKEPVSETADQGDSVRQSDDVGLGVSRNTNELT
jgi:hypothetical protein